MIKNRIKKFDEQERICIPDDLMELLFFEKGEFVAVCRADNFENSILITHRNDLYDIQDCEIIMGVKIEEEKNRIRLSKDIIGECKEFEIFGYKNYIIIKEVS